jgi:hypothetical protein
MIYPSLYPNNSQYISDTIPSEIIHDKSSIVTIKFKNTGTTTWTIEDGYILMFGDLIYPVTGSVTPGNTATFIIDVNFPTPGTYYVSLHMNRYEAVFGESKKKTINVV